MQSRQFFPLQVKYLSLQGVNKMCDFAGSIGYFSFAFMQKNPQLESHVYDLPEVCALARKIKENEEYYNRITYHDFDAASGESFGNGYDLFFSVPIFLYALNAQGTLSEFLKKVNRSMEPGGLFISNHITTEKTGKEKSYSFNNRVNDKKHGIPDT